MAVSPAFLFREEGAGKSCGGKTVPLIQKNKEGRRICLPRLWIVRKPYLAALRRALASIRSRVTSINTERMMTAPITMY